MNDWIDNLRSFGSQNRGLSSYNLWVSLPYNRRAAVLILLYIDENDELCVVMTTRSNRLRSFPGQAAFPGGRSDFSEENPWDNALREAQEEIGFDSSQFEFERLCNLPVYMSANKLIVLPMVGFIKTSGIKISSLAPTISADEVQFVYSLRVAELFEKLHHSTVPMNVNDRSWYYHVFRVPLDAKSNNQYVTILGERLRKRYADVEGLTAYMLLDCVRIASGSDPESFQYLSPIGAEELVIRALKELEVESTAQ